MSKMQFKGSPFKIIVFSYVLLSFLFALLYLLPVSHHGDFSFVDAWFLSTSGISVTGLSTINISEKLTLFGQVLLLIEIQFGGIGIMAILGSLLLLIKGGSVSLSQQTLMSFDQNQKGISSVKQLMLFIFGLTIFLQGIGFIVFSSIIYHKTEDLSLSLFQGLFHAASSFTNAGFDLFGDSLIQFSTNIPFVLFTAFLLLMGVIGFPTILELCFPKGKKKSLYTKTTVYTHLILLILGFFFFIFSEWNRSLSDFSLINKITNAFFLSVTTRNGGLTTVDIGGLLSTSLIFVMILMFIGSSPSSCGGGIRTTTLATIIAKQISVIKGQSETVLFKKSLHDEDINKAHLTFFTFLFIFFVSFIVLSFIEPFPTEAIAFEVMSALTTTGLSMGITADLTILSKVIISFLMIIGRIGVIALIYGIVSPKKSHVKHVKEHLVVG